MASTNVAWFNNLPNNCNEDDFRAFANKTGGVTGVEFGPRNRMAWVTYASSKAADGAVASLNGAKFGDREVKVEMSDRDPNAPKAPRERRPAAEAREGGAPLAAGTPLEDKVIARGIPSAMTREQIYAHFEAKAGPIKRVALLNRSTAAISFVDISSAVKALGLTGTVLSADGETTTLTVEQDTKRPSRSPRAEGAAAPSSRAPRQAPTGPQDAVRIAVSGYPEGTTADEIKSIFATAGRINSVRMARDNLTGIIGFEESIGGDKALRMNGASYKGGKLSVEMALRQPRAPGEEAQPGRKRTSGEDGEERAPRAPVDLSSVVWVGNLPGAATPESVRAQFSVYGPIVDLAKGVIVTNLTTADASYAYVTFASAAAAGKAVSANGKDDLKIEHASRKPTKGRRIPRRREAGTA